MLNRNIISIANEDKFIYELNDNEIKKCTHFITKWNGLKLNHTNIKTKEEYKEKSKSWLNGRRAKQYSNTLYPIMMYKAQHVNLHILYTYNFY